ncbi:unnamed protein product [Didymodactylos carnosus]|uniref:Uncharacterized protein n=1 Tax=Didymodactylos carnosus TaxID=1234261 RepID=A0A815D6C9_9BILA|nr:unnamed protein product [Didymodactylos carnosus]CAF1297266.1 unnamed protein product [Didymodactylos carnosus]CAF3746403.1 unnamed protein product [Didymodactylos carnosus]CAF4114278.1 unnamed protein product [Didymodactylos carnosus]
MHFSERPVRVWANAFYGPPRGITFKMYSSPITAVKNLDDFICFAGSGPVVLIYDLREHKCIAKEILLRSSVIHGFETRQISPHDWYVVIFGQRAFTIIKWSNLNSTFEIVVEQISSPSWLLSAYVWQFNHIEQTITVLFGTALNQIYQFVFNKEKNLKDLTLLKSFDYTTLYPINYLF